MFLLMMLWLLFLFAKKMLLLRSNESNLCSKCISNVIKILAKEKIKAILKQCTGMVQNRTPILVILFNILLITYFRANLWAQFSYIIQITLDPSLQCLSLLMGSGWRNNPRFVFLANRNMIIENKHSKALC